MTAGVDDRWPAWLAPPVQPFFVEDRRSWPPGTTPADPIPAELRDTYAAWRVDRSLEVLWLDEDAFHAMPRTQRAALVRAQVGHGRGAVPTVARWSDLIDDATVRAQADGRRFVWWPSLVDSAAGAIVDRVVRSSPDGRAPDAPPSRHTEVTSATWRRAEGVLPDARRLAGSFPTGSVTNCFGTVLAGAGVSGAEQESVEQAPFESWLAGACRPGGRDEDSGTVLVWRDREGLPVHAAVTIGDGWALEKASQEWWTPRAVRTVTDVIRTTRSPGQRLERHRLGR